MKRIMMAGIVVVCMTSVSTAGESDLYDRIDQLERQNRQLRAEVERLRDRLQNQSLSRNRGYYGNDTLRQGTRSLQDVNRLKDSFERLVK